MQRSKDLEPLSHDHFEGLLVVRRLRSGLAKDAAREEMEAFVVHFWDAYLTEHFRQEETLLIAPLEQLGGAELAAQMVGEHRMLAEWVEAMRAGTSASGTLRTFTDALQKHIRFEEREVFPYLERHLDEEALHAIGARLHADHVEADLSWPVAFWA